MNSYTCDCGTEHKVPAYAVAQAAMGHTLYHRCPCGRRNLFTSYGEMEIGKLPPKVQAAADHLAAGRVSKSWYRLLEAAFEGALP